MNQRHVPQETTRADYKKVTIERIQDAQVLFRGRRYAAAYYMAGYAIECAIKVKLAEQFKKHTVPTQKQVNEVYSHDLEKLMGSAGLEANLKVDCQINPTLRRNWNIVKSWAVDTRYTPRRSQTEARAMLEAVAGPIDGVLSWLQRS